MRQFFTKIKKGFSLVEVMVGITILSIAVIPMLSFSTNQSVAAFSASKHLTACQLASSCIDEIMSSDFGEAVKKLNNYKCDKKDIFEHHFFKDKENLDQSIQKDLKRIFNLFQYSYDIIEYEKGEYISFKVEMYYRNNGTHERSQRIRLQAIKYNL